MTNGGVRLCLNIQLAKPFSVPTQKYVNDQTQSAFDQHSTQFSIHTKKRKLELINSPHQINQINTSTIQVFH